VRDIGGRESERGEGGEDGVIVAEEAFLRRPRDFSMIRSDYYKGKSLLSASNV